MLCNLLCAHVLIGRRAFSCVPPAPIKLACLYSAINLQLFSAGGSLVLTFPLCLSTVFLVLQVLVFEVNAT